MTSFFAMSQYNPAVVLLVGLFALAGFFGLGAAISRLCRLDLPVPWRQVTAVLLGIQTVSLAVQVLGMAGLTSMAAMIAIAVGLMAFGAAYVLSWASSATRAEFPTARGLALLPHATLCLAVTACLLVAIAPSTKIDELYYHMLLPSRILSDGALLFYREPWVGAILPHMIFQISTTPVHAIGYPDAGNVISWSLGATLLWFAWKVIDASAKPLAWTYFWTAALSVGLYPVVWHVTAGSHAMGALAMAAATVAYCLRQQLLATIGPVGFAGFFSILALSASSTKVTLLPLACVMLFSVSWPLVRSARERQAARIVLALLAPWVVFFLPIAVWTWAKSGSPFGPMLSSVFSASIYDVDAIADTLRDTRSGDQLPVVQVAFYALINYSPLLLVGTLGALTCTDLTKITRLAAASFLAFQIALILLMLNPDIRYLGGIHFGLVIMFAAHATSQCQGIFMSKRNFGLAFVVLVLPWLGLQLFYAQQFFPAALGLVPKESFYTRYIAYYEDFQALNRILPRNAVIFWLGDSRPDAVYAPRPVYMDRGDLPKVDLVYVAAGSESIGVLEEELPGYMRVDTVYSNSRAVTDTFRTPGKPSLVHPLWVVRMRRK